MGEASPAIVGFNAGILDPKVGGRIDIERYRLGALVFDNFMPEIEGPATKRPGTKHIAPPKYDERESRLIPFEFSDEQAYLLELGDLYMRVHRNQSTVLDSSAGKTKSISNITATNPIVIQTLTAHTFTSGEHVYIDGTTIGEINGSFWRVGTTGANTFEIDIDGTSFTPQVITAGTAQSVYEISTTYLASEVSKLKKAPSLDELFLVLPGLAGSFRKITRLADDNFTIADVWTAAGLEDDDSLGAGFVGMGTWPPFAPANATSTTISWPTDSAPGVTIVLTASAALFTTDDVGRYIRVSGGGVEESGFALVTVFNSTTSVDVVVKSRPYASSWAGALVTKNWAWTLFDDVNGWPRGIAFYEDRLFMAGAKGWLQTWCASVSGAFDNFRPYSDDGSGTGPAAVIAADSGIVNTVNSDKQNAIEWLLGHDTLFMGTRGGEFTIKGANIEQGIQPANLFVKKRASYGSREDVEPIAVDTVVLFIQRAGRKLKELNYDDTEERFSAPDLNRLARESLFGRLKYIDYQQEPSRILWCVQDDGDLSTLTYEKEEKVAAWATHSIGGSNTFIESVAVIPSLTDDEDEVWFVIRRTFGGVTTRSIELLDDYWDRRQDLEDAILLDSSISFENPKVACETTAILYTLGVPVANFVYCLANTYSEGDRIELVSDPVHPDWIGKQYLVGTSVGGYGFFLNDLTNEPITDETELPGDGSQFRLTTNRVTGAHHLAGQTVGVFASGITRDDVAVSALGVIALPFYSGKMHFGHKYESRLKPMRLEAGGQDGTAQGKPGAFKRVVIRLDQTGPGLYIGTGFDDAGADHVMDYVDLSDPYSISSASNRLYDGDTPPITIPGKIDSEKTIALKHIEPTPCSIVALFPKAAVQDD